MASIIHTLLFVSLLLLFQKNFVKTENVTTPTTLPSATELASRQGFIKNMTLDAWNVYKQHAWGYDKVLPETNRTKEWDKGENGRTIVSSLPTFHLMGLTKQFNQDREWVKNEHNLSRADNQFGAYVTIIHHLGGLLSTYALTGDELFFEESSRSGLCTKKQIRFKK